MDTVSSKAKLAENNLKILRIQFYFKLPMDKTNFLQLCLHIYDIYFRTDIRTVDWLSEWTE
jgi:hypothetical protein